MKTLRLLCSIIIIIIPVLAFGQNSNFVYLQGKQFKLNGNNFYPVSMNYLVDIVRDAQGKMFVSPNHDYDSGNFECYDETGCYNQIIADLMDIKSMGFNSIRLVGLGFGTAQDQFKNKTSYPAFFSQSSQFIPMFTEIQAPYTQMFNFIQKVLDAAKIADIKVQLLVGGKENDTPALSASYTAYLQSIASHFSDNSTLYSYDFINEPLYESTLKTKAEVCSLVSNWNDAIHNNSPNHLTTIGLAASPEVFIWDPGLLKLDFLSIHVYPKTIASDGYDQQTAIDRVKSEIKWVAETSELPWMIGETGYLSNIDDSNTSDMGSLQDQKNYAKQTLEFVRDCGGSGYSWWQYQDVRWGIKTEEGKDASDNYGLVSNGNIKKPATEEFMNFKPFTLGSSCTTPLNYYNYNNEQPYYVSGYIKDQFAQPIKNAVVYGWTDDYATTTYSRSDGYFLLKLNKTNRSIRGSATRSSNFRIENVGSSINITLTQAKLVDAINVQNIVISNTNNYDANNSITVSNVTINSGGSSTMKATNSISIEPGFDAQIERMFVDCNQLSSYSKSKEEDKDAPMPISTIEYMESKNPGTIDNKQLTVFPNPSEGIFTIILNAEKTYRITVTDIVGQNLLQLYIVREPSSTINLSNYSKGTYLLLLSDEENNKSNFKLIVN